MSEYVPSPEYLDLLRRRREAAERLGVTPKMRAAIVKSKVWNSSTAGHQEFVDRQPDPYEQRFAVRGLSA